MNLEQLQDKLKQLDEKHWLSKKALIERYAKLHSRYKVGDKFTDSKGTIIIDHIWYYFGKPYNFRYSGRVLNKDGSERKRPLNRDASLLDEVRS